jgi:hypothetical protein
VKAAGELIEEARAWVLEKHPHPLHLERALHWLDVLEPAATPGMRLAALLHDIERADPDPDQPFDSARDWHRDAYLSYHQGRCALHLTRWLAERDAAPQVFAESVALVAVHECGGWPAANAIQAADSLSFIETMQPLLREWVSSGRNTPERALARLDAMWERMRVPAAFAVGRATYDEARREWLG